MNVRRSRKSEHIKLINPNSIEVGQGIVTGHNCILDGSSGIIVIEDNVTLGHNCIVKSHNGRVHIRENTIIGNNSIINLSSGELHIFEKVNIGNFCVLDGIGGKIEVGKNTKIEDYSRLYSEGGEIIIGKDVKIDAGNEIRGKGTVSLGDKCHLWSGSYINAFQNPFIFGFKVSIGQKCVIAGRGVLLIEKLTMIGGQTYIVTETHGYNNPFVSFRDQDFVTKGITIGEDVWVAAACRIVDGVTIGRRALIGMGTIVTKNVPEYMLALGTNQHHIKFIKDRREDFVATLEAHVSAIEGVGDYNNEFDGASASFAENDKGDIFLNAWAEMKEYLAQSKRFETDQIATFQRIFARLFKTNKGNS